MQQLVMALDVRVEGETKQKILWKAAYIGGYIEGIAYLLLSSSQYVFILVSYAPAAPIVKSKVTL